MEIARSLRLACLAALLLAGQRLSAQQDEETERTREAPQLQEVKEAVGHGIYDRAARACQYMIQEKAVLPGWHELLVRCLVAQGRDGEALEAAEVGVKRHPDDLPLLLVRYQTLAGYGKKDEAKAALQAINDVAKKKSAKQFTPLDLVALGQAALAAGADPAKVLQQYFMPARRKDAKLEEPYLAAGFLALDHSDYSRAATEFRAGIKEHGESAELRYGLARAFAPGDREASLKHIEQVLEMNSHHEGAMVLKAEHFISAEKFDDAAKGLDSAIEVNAHSPLAWALRSVIATLRDNDLAAAKEARTAALELWAQNPLPDHVIGRCLSHAYRFAEGAQCQREALAMDATFQPARLQLSSDLMRLGETDEAWKLTGEVRAADGYNTQAHNLGLLEKEMAGYRVQRDNDFIFRMTERDWQVYGDRALELLREAKAVLGPKYGHTFTKPVMVEFFPSQQDFAIRTFGALGGQGLLGVCFGTVITMNSPGSLAHGRNNWESTLWHEFCHVVTLSVTRNRMPRWLSEGISVYEERQRDPSWGMRMNADFRRLILDEDKLTPLSQLSSAFMNAQSSEEMLLAYYESSMAVEWLIQKHGWGDAFRAILKDLADGKRVNEAIEAHTAPMEKLEPAFREFMIEEAKSLGEKADWSKPEPADVADADALKAYLKAHPTNLEALGQLASQQADAKDWEGMAATAQKLIDLNPEDTSADSGWWLKAKALHQLKHTNEEVAMLRALVSRSSDSVPAWQRLLELDEGAKAWPQMQQDAGRLFALNPFLPRLNEQIAVASSAQGKTQEAVRSYERALTMKPANPAQTHFELAKLLKPGDAGRAKRHLLDALVLAPRWREAQALLLEMQGKE